MSKHTPGPWHWRIEDKSMAMLTDGGEPARVVLSSSPCRSCQETNDAWRWGQCMTPRESDAQLIADAPDLLDALAELVRVNEYSVDDAEERAAYHRAMVLVARHGATKPRGEP